MENSEQRSKRSSAPTEYSPEQFIIHGERDDQPSNSGDEHYELTANVAQWQHTRRSVDDIVVRLKIVGAEFANVDARSLTRRFSWSPRSIDHGPLYRGPCIDRPADDVMRCFSNDCFDVRRFTFTGSSYIDHLLCPAALLDETCHNRPSYRDVQNATCLEDVTDTRHQGCDEGPVSRLVSSARHIVDNIQQLTITSPGEMDNSQDVMQRLRDNNQRAIDDLFVAALSNDDSKNTDNTLSEHSLYDDSSDDSDDVSDNDDDAGTAADDSTSNDWLTLDTDSNSISDGNIIICSSALQTSTVTRLKSVGSQTSLKLLALDSTSTSVSCRRLRDIATQTELDCLTARANHQQPTGPVTRPWQQRRVVDQHSRRNSWCNENHNSEDKRSNNAPYDLEQVASRNRQKVRSLWTPHVQHVRTPTCVNEYERTLCNSAECYRPDGVFSDSLADQNYEANHMTLLLDSRQRIDLKKSDKARRKIIVGDVRELYSTLSDHDSLSEDRDTLADGRLGRMTKYDDNSSYESVTSAADSIAEVNALLATRNGYKWHIDFEQNTRIWKLLVS